MGLLKIHNGQAALELTTNQDMRWKRNIKVRSTIAMKRKSMSEFKARLVLRGDQVSEQDTAFASASTACRGSMAMLLAMNVLFRFHIYMVDISQAFLQADERSWEDKTVTTVPPYVVFPGPSRLRRCVDSGMPTVTEAGLEARAFDEYQKMPAEMKRSNFRRCLITHRPVYGGRDAPLRWFLRISSALRKGMGKYAMRSVHIYTS